MSTIFSNARKCTRCGHEWIRKAKDFLPSQRERGDTEPRQCPKCRSEKWQQEQESHETMHTVRG
jgi:predicted  nucleic acid-binding Zn ribbon protein